ncbi:MAG: hypothetical protein ABSC76_14655 [Terracidiphilus sp.]|jgi:hypothetical protein
MIVELLNRFEPESEGLLREVSKHISNNMLEEIAAADYGEEKVEHLAALQQVRDTGTFPEEKMPWFPMEVLELTRWSEPDTPSGRPTDAIERGHWMRAFSCTAILRATREPWNYGDGLSTDKTTIKLILSLRVLPVDFTPQAVKSLAWLLLNSEPEGQDEQVCAYGIGLLWFALQLASPLADEMLVSLSRWILRRAEEFHGKLYCGSHPYLRKIGFGDLPPSRWEVLGNAFFDLDLSARPAELQECVALIGRELGG